MTFNWEEHRLHREQVIEDQGQWVGLLDSEGIPICDVAPIIDMHAPETRHEPSALSLTVAVRSPRGIIHPMVSRMVADGLGVDDDGALDFVLDDTLFIAVERAGGGPDSRRVFRVASTTQWGDLDSPVSMHIEGMDVLDMLASLPCPSIPDTWTGAWIWSDRDWAGMWSQTREIQDVKFASVADGFTVAGQAVPTIRGLIQRSLDTVFRAIGVDSDPPIVVENVPFNGESPHVIIRPTDGYLWETISSPALAAGVNITARMWLPGDSWGPSNLSKPTVVVRVGGA